jgi:hypothetical protein
LIGKENKVMANSKAVNELQSYINRGRKEEREEIVKALLDEACQLTILAERAGEFRKYDTAGQYLEQAKRLRAVVLTIRKMPRNGDQNEL